MVRKIFNFLYQESSSLNQAALLLGFLAFVAMLIGFLRDRLLAHIFGASSDLDIYYAAFRIPDMLFVTVASIVSLSVLVPFIIEKEREGREALRNFIDSIFSFFMLLMVVAVSLTYFFLPQVAQILFRGFTPYELERVVFISRLLLLSPVILGLSNLFGSLTQAYNRFLIYSLAPILYNAGIVIGILAFSERWGVEGVALGVIIGALLHILIQAPFVWSTGLWPRSKLSFNYALIEKVVKISLPRTLTLSISTLTLLFLTALAARMSDGAVSILSLSNNIQSISLSLIGVSYSLAAFPTLSRKFQDKEFGAFLSQMATSTRFIIFWSLPFTALLIVLRAQIVRVLLGSGLFDWPATRLTAAAVALFILSSLFQSLSLLFMRGFYSAGHTKKPFYINLFSTGVLMAVTYALLEKFYASDAFRHFIASLLKVEDVAGSALLMLPLGFSIGTMLNGVLLWIFFEKEFRGFSKGLFGTLFQGLGASFVMGGVSYIGLNVFSRYIDITTLPGIFIQGFLSGLLGIVAGVLVLIALRSRELSDVWQSLHAKFWKSRVIATDPEIV